MKHGVNLRRDVKRLSDASRLRVESVRLDGSGDDAYPTRRSWKLLRRGLRSMMFPAHGRLTRSLTRVAWATRALKGDPRASRMRA